MTQKSSYWDGIVTGDASLAPYTDIFYTDKWDILFSSEDNQGILDDYLNELAVSGVSGGVEIATGAGLVDGWFYENGAKETKTLDTPITNPRIDRIVARMETVLGTVRIFVIKGTEAATPVYPSLIQTSGVTWDMPLARVNITTAGVISVTDERQLSRTPMSEQTGMVLIEKQVSDGTSLKIEFNNIPQIYTDLLIVADWRGDDTGVTGDIFVNGDTTSTNYWRQVINSTNAPALVISALNLNAKVLLDDASLDAEQSIGWSADFPNYRGVFYKSIFQRETMPKVNLAQDLASEGLVWLNVSPITKIEMVGQTGSVLEGSVVSLYGVG